MSDKIGMKVRGSHHDTGEVLQMALALGCKASGIGREPHATPIDATFPDVELSNKAIHRNLPSRQSHEQPARPVSILISNGFAQVESDGLKR